MNKAILLLSFCLFLVSSSFAQLTKTIHQNFEVEGYSNLNLELVGEVEVEKWAGNTILTETFVEIYDATPAILKHFVNDGRYVIEGLGEDKKFVLGSKQKERQTIRSKTGECYEFIKIRLFVPDDFRIVDKTQLVREFDEETPTTSNNTPDNSNNN